MQNIDNTSFILFGFFLIITSWMDWIGKRYRIYFHIFR